MAGATLQQMKGRYYLKVHTCPDNGCNNRIGTDSVAVSDSYHLAGEVSGVKQHTYQTLKGQRERRYVNPHARSALIESPDHD